MVHGVLDLRLVDAGVLFGGYNEGGQRCCCADVAVEKVVRTKGEDDGAYHVHIHGWRRMPSSGSIHINDQCSGKSEVGCERDGGGGRENVGKGGHPRL